MDQYLEILGVGYGLTKEQIKKAYNKKAMEFHPDRNHGFKKEAEKKMKDLNNARGYILGHFEEYENGYYYVDLDKEEVKEVKKDNIKNTKVKNNKKNNIEIIFTMFFVFCVFVFITFFLSYQLASYGYELLVWFIRIVFFIYLFNKKK